MAVAPFLKDLARSRLNPGPAVDKEKPISKRNGPVSDLRSGGQVQALAL